MEPSQTKIKTPVEVQWRNSSPPLGKWVNQKIRVRANEYRVVKIWEPDKIWAHYTGNFFGEVATKVIRTYWIPEENRWCMLVPGQEIGEYWAPYKKLIKGQEAPEVKQGG